MVEVEVDIDDAVNLAQAATKQLPFALSLSTNLIGVDVANAQNRAMRTRFTIRKPSIIREAKPTVKSPLADALNASPFWVGPGDAAKKGFPVVRVSLKPQHGYFAKFEAGGSVTMTGNPIAIPTKTLRASSGERIPQTLTPRNLGIFSMRGPAGETIYAGKHARSRKGAADRSRKAFWMRPGGALMDAPGAGIWMRTGSGAGKRGTGADAISFLYKFVSSITIKPQLRFFETARNYVADHWADRFQEAFDYAMRTARR